MKITIAYHLEEEGEATRQLALLLREYPQAKVRKSARNAPFFHIYLTINTGGKQRRNAESA